MVRWEPRLEPVREPSHRLTQHKRRGSRSLSAPWGCEEVPTLSFKGSKPEAVPAGWSLICVLRATRTSPLAHHQCAAAAPTWLGMPDEPSFESSLRGLKTTVRPLDRVIAGIGGSAARSGRAAAVAGGRDRARIHRAAGLLEAHCTLCTGVSTRLVARASDRKGAGWRRCSPAARPPFSAIGRPGSSGGCIGVASGPIEITRPGGSSNAAARHPRPRGRRWRPTRSRGRTGSRSPPRFGPCSISPPVLSLRQLERAMNEARSYVA